MRLQPIRLILILSLGSLPSMPGAAAKTLSASETIDELTNKIVALGMEWDFYTDLKRPQPTYPALAEALTAALAQAPAPNQVNDSDQRPYRHSGRILADSLQRFLLSLGKLGMDSYTPLDRDLDERATMVIQRLGQTLQKTQYLPTAFLLQLLEQAAALEPKHALELGNQLATAALSSHFPTLDSTALMELLSRASQAMDCETPGDVTPWAEQTQKLTQDTQVTQTILALLLENNEAACMAQTIRGKAAIFLMSLGIVPLSGQNYFLKARHPYQPTIMDAYNYIDGHIWLGDQNGEPRILPVGHYPIAWRTDGAGDLLNLPRLHQAAQRANRGDAPMALLLGFSEKILDIYAANAASFLDADWLPLDYLYGGELDSEWRVISEAYTEQADQDCQDEIANFIAIHGSEVRVDSAVTPPGCFGDRALATFYNHYQAALKRQKAAYRAKRAPLDLFSRRATIEKLLIHYLDLLEQQTFGNMSAEEFYDQNISKNPQLFNELDRIDLFGKPWTREVWTIIVTTYLKLAPEQRNLAHLLLATAPTLDQLALKSVAQRISAWKDAILKIKSDPEIEDLLILVGQSESLLSELGQDLERHALQGHFGELKRDYVQQLKSNEETDELISVISMATLLIPGAWAIQAARLAGWGLLAARAGVGCLAVAASRAPQMCTIQEIRQQAQLRYYTSKDGSIHWQHASLFDQEPEPYLCAAAELILISENCDQAWKKNIQLIAAGSLFAIPATMLLEQAGVIGILLRQSGGAAAFTYTMAPLRTLLATAGFTGAPRAALLALQSALPAMPTLLSRLRVALSLYTMGYVTWLSAEELNDFQLYSKNQAELDRLAVFARTGSIQSALAEHLAAAHELGLSGEELLQQRESAVGLTDDQLTRFNQEFRRVQEHLRQLR